MLLTLALAAVLLNAAMGRDLNWDYFNYHVYAALLTGQDRLAQDFFAAGYQGYLNPLPYAPLAWMESLQWPSLAIASALAVWQSLNGWLLYLCTRLLLGNGPGAIGTAVLAGLLGLACGPFLSQLGSTFVDAASAPPVMAALWVMLRWGPTGPALAGAAALAGMATGLKWTNAPYAAAVLATALIGLAVAHGLASGARLRRFAAACAAMAGGFALVYTAWGWKLYREFGSPVFPIFNQWFKAPDFPDQGLHYYRFIPRDLAGWLWRPLEMAELRSWVYVETLAPDLRPATLLLLALILTGIAAARRGTATARGGTLRSADSRLVVLTSFMLVATVAWMLTSANGRYATPILLLLGPAVLLLARRVLGAHRAFAACSALLVLQSLHLATAGNPRWNPQHWTQDWLPAAAPQALREQPRLFVTLGYTSSSYLAPHVHRDSAFVNPAGLISLANGKPGWSRYLALRERWTDRITVVIDSALAVTDVLDSAALAYVDEMVGRLGLTVIHGPCQVLKFNDAPVVLRAPWVHREGMPRRLHMCEASLRSFDEDPHADRRVEIARIMDAFASRCPRYFAPTGVQVEGAGMLWRRHYGAYDLYLVVDERADLISFRQERQGRAVALGRMSTWETDAQTFQCRLPHNGRRSVETAEWDHATR